MGRILLLIIVLALAGCGVSKDPQRPAVRELQSGKVTEDTSFVYHLPYEQGKSHLIVQGYFGSFSHKNRIALDFKMKRGTKVLAARDGVVIRTEERYDKGGWNKKYRPYANLVVVQHTDGTRAGYWHLQQNGALVNVGDSVKQGQIIALSGSTGYSSMPHLHFMVWKEVNGNRQLLPTRFMTKKGPKYLRPLRWWKSIQ